MNGSRGAKGSIKDRIISMLYRIRYKKKVLKEEYYTKEEKMKELEYLEKLQKFYDTENIEYLEEKDLDILDKITFNVKFIPIKNSEYELCKIEKESNTLNDFDLKLCEIEDKNSELDKKTDIKKSKEKTKLEVTIIEEIENFINDTQKELYEIDKCVDYIKKEVKNHNQDLKLIDKKTIELNNKIEKLKKQYDSIKDKYDLSDFRIVESLKIMDATCNYKSLAKLNEIEMLVKVCKKEITKIENITVIYKETKKVGKEVKNAKKEQNIVKLKFNIDKEKINNIENNNNIIENSINNKEEELNQLYSKAINYTEEIKKETYYVSRENLLSSILKIASGMITLPFTGRQLFGHALGVTLINKGLKKINKSFEKKEKIIIDYKYEDIENKLNEVSDKLDYTNLVIIDSLSEISKLKENFNNTFGNYNNILPEYKDMFDKLDTIEKKMLFEQRKIDDLSKNVDKEKELNSEKIKTINKKRECRNE